MHLPKKIKVLLVGWWFYPETSAGANRLMDLIKHINSEKYEIYAIARKIGKTKYKSILRVNSSSGEKLVSIYRTPGPSFLSWMNPFTFLGFFLMSIIIMKIKRINVMLGTVPEPENVFATSLAATLSRKPYIIDIRDIWEDARIEFIKSRNFPLKGKGIKKVFALYNRLLQKIFVAVYRKSKALTVVTSEMARIALRRKLNRRIIVIPNAADTDVFRPINKKKKKELRARYGISEKELVLLFQGNLNPEYKLDKIVFALKRLEKKGVKSISLVILGKAPEWSAGRKILDHIIDKLELRRKVLYLGYFRNRRKVAELLGLADIGIIPMEISDLWKYRVPLKFYEYTACGLPVIAFCSKDSELHKMIQKYQCGYTITKPTEIVPRLIEILLRINSRKEELETLSRNAVKLSNRINRKTTTKLFERLLNSISNQ